MHTLEKFFDVVTVYANSWSHSRWTCQHHSNEPVTWDPSRNAAPAPGAIRFPDRCPETRAWFLPRDTSIIWLLEHLLNSTYKTESSACSSQKNFNLSGGLAFILPWPQIQRLLYSFLPVLTLIIGTFPMLTDHIWSEIPGRNLEKSLWSPSEAQITYPSPG